MTNRFVIDIFAVTPGIPEKGDEMFTERLNELLEIIGAGNKDIAKYGGFDRTNLSRLRSGTRRPGRLSPTVDKLVSGIYLFSDDRNALKELCDVIGQDPDASAPQIRQRIADWLFEGEPEDTADTEKAAVKSAAAEKKKKQQASLRSLAERLDSSMTLAELSNVRLSHLVHTDASLISRYRNGMRSPLSNPVIAEQISHILLHRILRSGKEKELAALMRLQDGKPEEGNFTAWLFQTEELPERNIHIAEDMLGFFDSYTAGSRIQLPPWESVAQGLDPADARGAYFGTEGLREAVLRFLADAVKNRVSNLFLYSDEDQSWMTGDPAFLAAWASLMSTCVRNGTQIRIIHNIDRNLSEMNDAIRSWLPLYMSGMNPIPARDSASTDSPIRSSWLPAQPVSGLFMRPGPSRKASITMRRILQVFRCVRHSTGLFLLLQTRF